MDVAEEVRAGFRQIHAPSESTRPISTCTAMQVVLIRKLARQLDGIDVSDADEGDVLDLSRRDAAVLVAEGWALPYRGPSRPAVGGDSSPVQWTVVASGPARRMRTLEQLRRVREQMETRHVGQQERRRAEDRIREELHDAQSRTVPHR